MAKRKMNYSLFEDKKRNTDRVYKYESFWGTVGTKNAKKTTSIVLAKHPVMTWAVDLQQKTALSGFTEVERDEARNLVETIDQLGDFVGMTTFNLDLPTIGMRFQAIIARLPEPAA